MAVSSSDDDKNNEVTVEKEKPVQYTDWNNDQKAHQSHHVGRTVSIIFLCFVASFLGSWVFVGSGLVKVDTTQTSMNTREKVVSQEGEVMASLAKKVSPSVVSIVTKASVVNSFGQGSAVQGAGTGVVVSKDGYIMTNKHVIGDTKDVTVVTSDGTSYKDVEVIGEDPLNDLAFLKIKGVNNLTPAQLADSSKVQIGQKVVAIGNALGEYQNSVTSGIISGKGRPIVAQDGESDEQLDNLFQTDAAINPGNSGGPLLNLSGEVIGINTAIAQDAQGIGFAIPINASKGLIKTLLSTGKVERAYLGVRYVAITPQTAEGLGVSAKKGAYVQGSQTDGSAVVAGSPADKAGIKEKDIITKVNGQTVDENNGLALLLAEFSPGDKVTLTLQRGNETRTAEVVLGAYTN